ncbi:MAG: restriction endonuclease [Burkholderiales bacterium]|jgi:restriction system protein|nr:restriction endonuclease [Burkholderiales bacterium]
MARSRKNLVHDVIELTVRLPWWAGVAAALLSWVVLYWLIRTPSPVSFPSDVVVLPVLRGLAMGLQYLLPAVFLAAAAVSAWLRYKQYKNYADVAGERGHAALELLTWREFEHLVAEFFRRKGFHVEQRGGRELDGGVDLVASIGEDRYLVQCKHWRVQRVGVKVVREICGVAAAENAAGVFVVTSGTFTDEARRFVEENRIDIELIAGDQLRRMIQGLETTKP